MHKTLSLVVTMLLILASNMCNAETKYNWPLQPTVKNFNHILLLQGATQQERLMLLTLGIVEAGGHGSYDGLCKLMGGCDKGRAHTIWQIQCTDEGTGNINAHLRFLRHRMQMPLLRCFDLDTDHGLATEAAMIMLDDFKRYISSNDPINIMMMWGGKYQTNPQERKSKLIQTYTRLRTYLGE